MLLQLGAGPAPHPICGELWDLTALACFKGSMVAATMFWPGRGKWLIRYSALHSRCSIERHLEPCLEPQCHAGPMALLENLLELIHMPVIFVELALQLLELLELCSLVALGKTRVDWIR